LACPFAACPEPIKLKCWCIYTPLGSGLHAKLVLSCGPIYPGTESGASHGTAKCPERLCTHRVLPGCAAASRAASAGVTPPSSLIRAHASDQNPPADFGSTFIRRVFAGCHQSLLGVGPSRRYLRNPCIGAWTPTPQRPFRCICSFLPEGLRPHLRLKRFGTPDNRRDATSTTLNFSRLQSFRYVQAPILARPPGCTHRCGSMSTGQPGRLHHAMNMRLPVMNRGIATCLNRATGTAGLSPAGSRPCRPLPKSPLSPPECKSSISENIPKSKKKLS
jgi:hypothetical protein